TQAIANLQCHTSLRIGINGCAQCCVPCHTLDISVIGEPNGYRISIGGRSAQIPEMAQFVAEGVPADRLVELLVNVVNTYNEHAEEGEPLQEVLERIGSTPFVDALAPYSQDAASDEDPFSELGGVEDTPVDT